VADSKYNIPDGGPQGDFNDEHGNPQGTYNYAGSEKPSKEHAGWGPAKGS